MCVSSDWPGEEEAEEEEAGDDPEASGKKKKGKIAPLKIKIGRKKKPNKDSEVMGLSYVGIGSNVYVSQH